MLKCITEDEINNNYFKNTLNKLLKNRLIKSFDFEEKIENGRIVLENRKIKLVEIKNTDEDKKKYYLIMNKYHNYINKYYKNNIVLDNLDSYFCDEISTKDGKLPLFFVYTKNENLIGTCGFSKKFSLSIEDSNFSLQELSVRIFQENNIQSSSGYGSICSIMIFLYAMRKNTHVYIKSFSNIRDYMFHLLSIDKDILFYYKTAYICVLQCNIKFDIFLSLEKLKKFQIDFENLK